MAEAGAPGAAQPLGFPPRRALGQAQRVPSSLSPALFALRCAALTRGRGGRRVEVAVLLAREGGGLSTFCAALAQVLAPSPSPPMPCARLTCRAPCHQRLAAMREAAEQAEARKEEERAAEEAGGQEGDARGPAREDAQKEGLAASGGEQQAAQREEEEEEEKGVRVVSFFKQGVQVCVHACWRCWPCWCWR